MGLSLRWRAMQVLMEEKIPSQDEFGWMTTPLLSTVGGELNRRQSSDANICFGIPKESEVRHHIWVT